MSIIVAYHFLYTCMIFAWRKPEPLIKSVSYLDFLIEFAVTMPIDVLTQTYINTSTHTAQTSNMDTISQL